MYLSTRVFLSHFVAFFGAKILSEIHVKRFWCSDRLQVQLAWVFVMFSSKRLTEDSNWNFKTIG